MRVCIEKDVLGTRVPLVVGPDDMCEWQDCQCDAYLYSRTWRHVHVEHLAKMAGIPLDKLSLIDPAHIRAFESLGVNSGPVPWALVLGKDRFKKRIKEVVETIQCLMRDPQLDRYVETYRTTRGFLAGLERPKIDSRLLHEYKLSNESGASVLSTLTSFAPREDGLAPEIEYDQVATSTGRLTVSRGPQVLTLPKANRNIINSKTGGGIYELDFVSLEPRFALHMAGVSVARDVYEDVRARIGASDISRSDVKLAVISALYGSSSTSLAGTMGSVQRARKLISDVKEMFRVDALVSRLRDMMSRHAGVLHNHYGRPLLDVTADDKDSKLISHFIQSSSVDATLLGFSQFMQRVQHLGVKPIYVIHDALLLDVPHSSIEELQRESAAGVDTTVGHFELGLKKVS